MKTLLLILVLLAYSSHALLCPKTRLEFFSHFSLGKQDELNRTFTAISKNVTFPQVVYNSTATERYRLGDYNVTWRYIDSNQKANISSHDSVIVWGGHLRVDVAFNWSLIGSSARNGTGRAYARTENIEFAKNLTTDNTTGYVMWNLVNHLAIDLDDNKFVVERINPYNENDLSNITKMMNHMINNSGFADLFLQGVNILMDLYLNASLHDEHFQQENFVNYTYNHPVKGPIVVQYDIVIGTALIEANGLHIFSSDVIKNYNDFVCGKAVPNEPLDVQHYGGLQTFLSMGFVESTAKWGLANGVYDTDLNEDAWESRHFQFFAGDLYDVIPALQKKFYPSNKLNGNCKALSNGFSFGRGSSETFNVSIQYNCSLNSESSGKILDFAVSSKFVVKGVALSRNLDFTVAHADFNATYYQTGEYVVTNIELANYYLNSTAWSVRNSKVFGSNFSTIARDYPHFEISKDEYVVIYDSSQVGEVLKTE